MIGAEKHKQRNTGSLRYNEKEHTQNCEQNLNALERERKKER